MLELAQIAGAPQVLEWQKRLVQLAPTPENELGLAAAALQFETPPYPTAKTTLLALSAKAPRSVACHMLAAELALKNKQPADAEMHFSDALRLDPTNTLCEFNLAVLQLSSTNPAIAGSARRTLLKLTQTPALAANALQWLVSDSIQHADYACALRSSQRLLALDSASIDDRLVHASLLARLDDPSFPAHLADTQFLALTNGWNLYAVSTWMLQQGLVDQCLEWLTNLPPACRTEPGAQFGQADCFSACKSWNRLEQFLGAADWGEFDYLRLALLSHAMAGQEREFAADGQWRLAVRAAGERLPALKTLLAMAQRWERPQAREELLGALTRQFPSERWAWRELVELYTAQGNTRSLNKVYSSLYALDNSDLQAKNNLAATSLLLGQDLSRAHRLADELYSAQPGEPIVASTYAYSLHLRGRSGEALAVMERLQPGELESPALAVYYGLLLKSQGQGGKAVRYLALGRKGRLLPEEKVLAE